MKSKLLSLILLAVVAMSITSCYSSRRSKTGCPVNVKAPSQTEATKAAA